MTKRAVIYARVSYDDRDTGGRNLTGQIEMGREYAERKGYTIVAELSEDDKGASGAEINLPQLNKIRGMARAGKFGVLVVREIDRLSRNLAKQLIVEEELKRAGVEIDYVLGEYPDTPEGNFQKHIKGSVAEYEREKIKERMMYGKYLKVSEDKSVMVSTGAPYGYDLERCEKIVHLSPKSAEAATVRQIYAWFVRDGLPIREIVRRLDKLGAPLPQTGGRQRAHGWPRSTVFKILRCRTYVGKWQYHHDTKELLIVDVPPIVDKPLWDAAQTILDKRRERMARATKYDYIMGGRRLLCGTCGKPMRCEPQTQRGRLYLYYVCSGGCRGMRVRTEPIDAPAWEWLASILKDPDKLESEIDVYQKSAAKLHAPILEQAKITDELLSDNRAKLDRLVDLYLNKHFTLEDLTARKAQLEQTIVSLEKQRAELSAQMEGQVLEPEQLDDLRAFSREITDRLDNATHAQKVQLFQTLNVTGTFAVEEGEKVLYLRSIIRPTPDFFTLCNTATRPRGRSTAGSRPSRGW